MDHVRTVVEQWAAPSAPSWTSPPCSSSAASTGSPLALTPELVEVYAPARAG